MQDDPQVGELGALAPPWVLPSEAAAQFVELLVSDDAVPCVVPNRREFSRRDGLEVSPRLAPPARATFCKNEKNSFLVALISSGQFAFGGQRTGKSGSEVAPIAV